MNTLKFKSNINCTGCLSKVTPVLNDEKAIEKWDVDLEHDDRILTVKISLTIEHGAHGNKKQRYDSYPYAHIKNEVCWRLIIL